MSLIFVRHSPVLIRIASFMIYLATSAFLIWFLIQWFQPKPDVVPMVSSSPSPQFQLDQSAEARLLGAEVQGGVTPPSVQVIGVFASSSGLSGAAVLAVEGNIPQSYQVGQHLVRGWQIDRITTHEVVISRSGQEHRVAVPQQMQGDRFMTIVPST